jgi:hypothetical protein
VAVQVRECAVCYIYYNLLLLKPACNVLRLSAVAKAAGRLFCEAVTVTLREIAFIRQFKQKLARFSYYG